MRIKVPNSISFIFKPINFVVFIILLYFIAKEINRKRLELNSQEFISIYQKQYFSQFDDFIEILKSLDSISNGSSYYIEYYINKDTLECISESTRLNEFVYVNRNHIIKNMNTFFIEDFSKEENGIIICGFKLYMNKRKIPRKKVFLKINNKTYTPEIMLKD